MSVNHLTPSVAEHPETPEPERRGPHRLDCVSDPLLAKQAEAIAAHLPALMRQLFTFEDDAVEELPLAQLRVCGLLADGPRPMSALRRELGVSLSAITQVADRLERAQLVQRQTDGTDRRLRCLQLTERGAAMMRHHEQARLGSVLAVLKHLSAETRQEVLDALERLLEACLVLRGPNP
jgi:DNA-binding MarR family transcriptional regulator